MTEKDARERLGRGWIAERSSISACSHSISTSLFLEAVSRRGVNDDQRGAGRQVAQSDLDSLSDRVAGIDEAGITGENGSRVGARRSGMAPSRRIYPLVVSRGSR